MNPWIDFQHPAFTEVEEHWMAAAAALAVHGGRVIVEDSFVSGPPAQQRWKDALSRVETRWVGSTAPPPSPRAESLFEVTETGMATRQADSVHLGIHYDFAIDTSASSAPELAERIRDALWPASERPQASRPRHEDE